MNRSTLSKTQDQLHDFRIFEAIPGVAVLILPDPPQFTLIAVTNDFLRASGMKRTDVIGKSHFDVFPRSPDDPNFSGEKHLRESFEYIIANKATHEISLQRYDIPNGDGTFSQKYWKIRNAPVLNESGELVYIAHSASDISDQVIAEEQFQTLANSITQLAWMADGEGWIYWYNQRWYEYTGTTLEEMQGWGWEKVHHPDHINRILEFVKGAWKIPEPFELTFPLRSKAGHYRWFLTRAYPVQNKEGKIIHWIGTNTDIHEQKQVETLLEEKVRERTLAVENQKSLLDNILKNSSNGISVTEMIRDNNGKIVDAATILANDAAVKFTGLPREIYLSKTAKEIAPDILESPYGLTCLNTLKTAEPAIIQYQLEITGRWLELTISKMDNDHLIHIFTDVTPIKETQLQLERMVEELKRSNTNLEEFAYAASHDLKEPIRKINNFIDRIQTSMKDRMEEKEKGYFKRMELAAKRMNALIEDLLDYSHVSIGPRESEEINLNELVSLVLSDLDLEIEEKQATITVGNLFVIKGHHRQLQQAFQNLITNSLKYKKPEVAPEITIVGEIVNGKEIGLGHDLHHQHFYSIVVSDNGIGFEQNQADRIFNVFTRLNTDTDSRGSGVGLSIVRKVIENHKGFVKAESVPGKGAKFIIYLPV